MNLKTRRMLTSLVALAVLGASVPALADDQHSRRAQGQRTAQQAPPSQSGRQAQPSAQPRQAQPSQAPRGAFGARPDRGPAPALAPQGAFGARPDRGPQGQPARPQVGPRSAGPQASSAPRGYAAPRGSVAPRGYAAPPSYSTRGHAVPRPAYGYGYGPSHGYGYGARPYYAYPYGYRPYYSFHPHFFLSFGFSVGYPVAYPTWYNPYAVGTFGYGVPYGVAYGGLSFNVQPYDAAVFIDGVFIGSAYDFGPQSAPLTLRAGLHHIELRANDCQPIAFDITVVPGQVIPYEGTMPLIR